MSTGPISLTTPLAKSERRKLKAGDAVMISGVIYTARDAAHRRMIELLDRGQDLPFDPRDQIIYYCGPSPAKPGQIIGAVGPTTAYRMDDYTPRLYQAGLAVSIGKGRRSSEVRYSMVDHGGLYMAALGGAGALLNQTVKEVEVIAWPELGPEAVRRMVVEDFPAVVINDTAGRDLYQEGQAAYRR